MMACPIEDFSNLVPITDLLKSHVLDRGSCDDEAVVLLVAHILKVGIEGLHVLHGSVLRGVALYFHEAQLYLQG